MTPTFSSRWPRQAGWLLVTLVAVGYAPMAMEYFAHFLFADAPRLWLQVFSGVTSVAHAQGPGSIEAEQARVYAASAPAMGLHSVCGGLVILLASLQFHAGFRRRFPRGHRVLGRLQAAVVVVGMLAAIAYLLRTGPAATFDGPPFYLQLWALALATLLSTVLAVVAIRQGQVAMHYCLMAYNFVLLMSAPGLRVGYLVLGGMDPTLTQEMTNMASAIIYAFLVVPMAAIASRALDARPASAQPRGRAPGRGLLLAIWGTGLAVAAGLGLMYRAQVGGWSWLHGVLLGTALASALLFGGGLWRATRRGLAVARHEWSVHLAALGLVPVAMWALWEVLTVFFTRADAFWGAVLVGPALALSLGLLVVVWSRRVEVRDAAIGGAGRPAGQFVT